MTGAQIALFILQYGLPALEKLISSWNTPMTNDQVQSIFNLASTSYDQYIKDAQATLPLAPPGT